MLVEFSILPVGKGISVSKSVTKAINLVDKSGLDYKVSEMGTIVEGEWKEIISLIERCHRLLLKETGRVITTVKVDDRRGRKGLLRSRIRRIERILRRKINS